MIASTAQIILAMVQVGKLANETIALYQSGSIDDDEVIRRWSRLQDDLKLANSRWENAAKDD